MSQRTGILAAGNWIIDVTKFIDVWPAQDTLANVLGEETNNGGGAYNLLKDLARLGAPFPLEAAGLVGEDQAGELILEDCREHAIDTRQLQRTPEAPTSHTDVMLVKPTGRRTFFHMRGANDLFDAHHVDFEKSDARIFYLGYLLLLDMLDVEHSEHGTRAAEFLAQARAAGFRTCIDVVSEDSDRFHRIVFPALRHTDICIMNEFEAGRCTGRDLRPGGEIHWAQAREAAQALLDGGVGEVAIIHFPEGAIAATPDGKFLAQGSVRMPAETIEGATGAGDAFAAGVLYVLHDEMDLGKALRYGVCAAASCLTAAGTSSGILPMTDALALGETHGFRETGT